MSRPVPDDRTRKRLLRAAGEIFARKGFREATVREICARAGANVAAINYHFGSKENLYAELLKSVFDEAVRRHPPDMGLPPEAPAERRLEAFVRSMLRRVLAKGKNAWHARILAREMASPTRMLGDFVDSSIIPQNRKLRAIVAELLGPGAAPAEVALCARSVVAQCRNHATGNPILSRVFPETELTEASLDLLAGHITRFSLAGIAATRRPPTGPHQPPTSGVVP